MKTKIIPYLLLIWILSSCSHEPVKNNIIIEGRIPELASVALQINLKDSIYRTFADKTGEFRFDILLNNPRYVYVKGLDRKLYLIPNDSLIIKSVNDKYAFSGGQSALINNYYTDWKTYLYAVADTADSDAYYNQKPEDFLKSNAKWIEVWKKPLNELQKQHSDLNKDFIAFESARINYWMYGDLNDYKSSDAEIHDNFYQYLNKVNLNDTNLMQLDEYRRFLLSYVFMQAGRLNCKDKIIETSRMLDIIQETFKYELITNEIAKEIMRLQTSRLAINDTLFERFKTIYTDALNVNEIENNYQNLKPLLKGNKAPDFELMGLNDNKVTLKKFKGKYLLIDVWSTTCAPCFREFPILENIKQDLKDKNIEIIAACFSDKSAWKKALSKHSLKGSQFRIENGWKSEFKKDYLKSSGVPVYILIDPNGLIIDARAPKPSENLIEVINRLEI